MSEKILVPALGESVTEATVSKWLKNKGDEVTSDEPLVELETDKVNIEVPSPSNGTLEAISVEEGKTVNVGSLLGTISSSNVSGVSKIKEVKNYSPPAKKDKVQIKENKIKEKTAVPLVLEKEEKKEFMEEPLILKEEYSIFLF
mgnify:CR=1 FL=1